MTSRPLSARDRPWTVFLVFLRLGLSSFGGPVAHLGYFRTEFVQRRAWLSEAAYAELIALCQFLPGPASSQAGFALGWSRAGLAGALAAWLGFTLPSALLLIALAMGLSGSGAGLPGGLVHGLKIVAVAVVAQALWGMARTLCRGPLRTLIALVAAAWVLLWPTSLGQVCVMLLAGLLGAGWLRPGLDRREGGLVIAVGKRTGYLALALFVLLLAGLPLLAGFWPNLALKLADGFYRAGALVFGGGHVVLPLLQSEVVAPGWLGNDLFLAGYAAAQAMPGPLFSFAGFLGAAIDGWAGAVLCLAMIFLPAMLLIVGVLPFWQRLRQLGRVRAALAGVNAAVVGLLAAALYNPLWTSSIFGPLDLGLALLALAALMVWRLPPWLVVILGGASGLLLAA
ncbi:chromate efflux transporter [Pseudomonas chlororaphis]|uniref:Chromate transporter n=1 Tax=Pseudomonas chlororaphis TaxID=587753 RepID=A0A1Q8EQR1_9PSED|nr:chromate efflux transporter [Pseudomonas chlororaphis]OLF54135.1 chromate transporter [Pseudomonas chlororaphis]